LCTPPAFASHRCRSNQLASRIIWGSYGQHQIRSREDDSRDEPRRRRCKKAVLEAKGIDMFAKPRPKKKKRVLKKSPLPLQLGNLEGQQVGFSV
jgi:hypothetical protein